MVMSSSLPDGSYRFGPFRLDPASRVLDCDGKVMPLAPRTFDLLHFFVRSGGRLLTKQELLRHVWGDVSVEEASLAFQVSALRKALGEDGTAWIETVPKHGYRFTAPVREVRREDTKEGEAQSIPLAGHIRLGPAMWRGSAITLVAVLAAFVVFRWTNRSDAPVVRESRLDAVPFTSYTGREAEPTFSPDGAQVAFTWDGERARTITTSTSRQSARSSRSA